MNQKQLEQMKSKKGFIAALDQSGGSSPKALKAYGIDQDQYNNDEEMFDLMHQMRTRMIKSPSFSGDEILGAILFQNTMDRKIDGKYTPDFLWEEKGIIPFLKVDKGLEPEKEGVQLMKPITDLTQTLEQAQKRNIFGTKMRSVIHAANPEGIKKIVDQQFEYGRQIADAGFVTILEPEVDITIPDKKEAEAILKDEIEKHLKDLPENELIMLKLSIPTVPGLYSEIMKDPHVVRVVALSGGYTREEANKKLAENTGLIASFSRALAEGLNANQTEEEFNKTMKHSVDAIFEASIK